MTAEDLDEVLDIERGSFPRPWTRGQFESELGNPVSRALVLRVSDGGREPVGGYIIFWIVFGEAHILDIAVKQDMRGRGLAAALLNAALGQMRGNTVYRVFLEVRRSNAAARGLYRKFGFRESFVRKNYYGDEDAIVMTLVF